MSAAFAALFASIVRTVVPIIVGGIAGWAASINLTLDSEFGVLASTALTGLFTAIYYAGARLLETYVTPKFGWLLGLAKAPVVYATESVKTIEPAVASATAEIEVASAEAKSAKL